jgi:hypothetical protein
VTTNAIKAKWITRVYCKKIVHDNEYNEENKMPKENIYKS